MQTRWSWEKRRVSGHELYRMPPRDGCKESIVPVNRRISTVFRNHGGTSHPDPNIRVIHVLRSASRQPEGVPTIANSAASARPWGSNIESGRFKRGLPRQSLLIFP